MWWHTVTHGRGSEGGNWRMEWVASTLHTTSEHGVSSITTAHAHNSAASSPLNWRPRRFKWTRPFHRKNKSGFCACAITFQLTSTVPHRNLRLAGYGKCAECRLEDFVKRRNCWILLCVRISVLGCRSDGDERFGNRDSRMKCLLQFNASRLT